MEHLSAVAPTPDIFVDFTYHPRWQRVCDETLLKPSPSIGRTTGCVPCLDHYCFRPAILRGFGLRLVSLTVIVALPPMMVTDLRARVRAT